MNLNPLSHPREIFLQRLILVQTENSLNFLICLIYHYVLEIVYGLWFFVIEEIILKVITNLLLQVENVE